MEVQIVQLIEALGIAGCLIWFILMIRHDMRAMQQRHDAEIEYWRGVVDRLSSADEATPTDV